MDNIIEPSIDFDFSKLYLASPSSLTGGAYFTRIILNNKPLYIQTPKSLTKQGFIKSGKKIYTDLMFDHNDTILIHWLENLETKCQDLIYEKGEKWFDSILEKSDIESAFTSPIKIFKSGKFYLMRVNVKPNIKIYNEVDEIIPLEDVRPDMNIISILEIQGIKFTSRNFQMEIELKQSMIVSPDPFLDECFIKKPSSRITNSNNHTTNINTSVSTHSQLNHSRNIETIISPDSADSKSLEEIEIKIEEPKQQAEQEEQEEQEQQAEQEQQPEPDQKKHVSIFEPVNSLDTIDIHELKPINNNELTEINIEEEYLDNSLETESITLKKPNEVYYKIYKAAREKAKQAKKDAILAFLEAKNIKKTYMLDDIDDSDNDNDNDFDNYSEISESEIIE
jgi:hypothetical protein